MIKLIPINKIDVVELINYSFHQTGFGKVLIASTTIGICYLAFIDDEISALKALEKYFPHPILNQKNVPLHNDALLWITNKSSSKTIIRLHVKASDFQLNVWELLLKIPFGQTTSYNQLATKLKLPNGARAVGTAISKNPIAYLIPCHRVIGSNSELTGYRWGLRRKALILESETDKSSRLF